MSTGQPDEQSTPELDADAGINAIRLDAERAREELDKTLAEIERRLDPQRVIQPVKRTVSRSVTAIKTEYNRDPARFITYTVLAVGAVTAVLTWAGRGSASSQRSPEASPLHPNQVAAQVAAMPKPGKRGKKPQDPFLKSAKKTSKSALKIVTKSLG